MTSIANIKKDEPNTLIRAAGLVATFSVLAGVHYLGQLGEVETNNAKSLGLYNPQYISFGVHSEDQAQILIYPKGQAPLIISVDFAKGTLSKSTEKGAPISSAAYDANDPHAKQAMASICDVYNNVIVDKPFERTGMYENKTDGVVSFGNMHCSMNG